MILIVSREIITKMIQIPSPEKQKVKNPPIILLNRESLFKSEPTTVIKSFTKIDDVSTKITD